MKKEWLYDLVIVLLCVMYVLAALVLLRKCAQIDAETERVEELIDQAQARIDAYYASLPARERPAEAQEEPDKQVMVKTAPAGPVVVQAEPAEPVVVQAANVEPETPEWYIADVPLEQELQQALWDACQEFGVSYTLALAVIEVETNYSNIQGDGGRSIGYFQVQPRWWGELMAEIGVTDLTDPVDNFRTGCAVLDRLLEQYGGSVTDALTAYNSGHPGQSAYAKAVMERVEGIGNAVF